MGVGRFPPFHPSPIKPLSYASNSVLPKGDPGRRWKSGRRGSLGDLSSPLPPCKSLDGEQARALNSLYILVTRTIIINGIQL